MRIKLFDVAVVIIHHIDIETQSTKHSVCVNHRNIKCCYFLMTNIINTFDVVMGKVGKSSIVPHKRYPRVASHIVQFCCDWEPEKYWMQCGVIWQDYTNETDHTFDTM